MKRASIPILMMAGLLMGGLVALAQATTGKAMPAQQGVTGAKGQTDWTGAKKQPEIAKPEAEAKNPTASGTAGPPTDKPGLAGSEGSEVRDPKGQ